VTFGEALDQMSKGRVVARREWPQFARNIGVAIYDDPDGKLLKWCGPDRWYAWGPWLPNSLDMFASDWENVEAARPSN
jgi:hypothetical protein